MAFELPALPYAHNALEPFINTRTMELHHGKHHQAYVDKLNDAVKGTEWEKKDVETIIRKLDEVPEKIRTAVRNNGGGHVNHAMFWNIMGPKAGGEPKGELAKRIQETFGDFESFKQKFNDAGGSRFGSGWVWLVTGKDGRLEIMSTPNQDSPLSQGYEVVMGNDVWEHAYYLTYENRRPDYLKNWWNVVNWDAVTRRWEHARKGK